MATGDLGFIIIGQEKTEELTPDGRFVDTYRITYQTPSGVIDYVRCPAAQYDVNRVNELIKANVAQVEAVHALGTPNADAGTI